MITLLTFVSRRKVRTSWAARSSRKNSLTEGARGCFHSQAFRTVFHSSLVWGDRARQLAKRWWRDCRLPPPHHQHSPDQIVLVFSARYESIAACLETSWKKRLATSFLSIRRSGQIPLSFGGQYRRLVLAWLVIQALVP